MTELSVTEVRNALRCPRVFALGRIQGEQVSFPIGSSALGGLFHRIAERLHMQAAAPPAAFAALTADNSAREVHAALSDWLLGYLAESVTTSPAQRSMAAELDELAEALRELASYLAEHVTGRPGGPAAALADFLRGAEISVEQVLGEAAGSGEAVRLVGRVDAIFAPDDGAPEVIEYKLTDEDNEELDQAQVALYRQMLRWDRGLEATPVILRFKPQLATTRLSGEAADALAARELFPLIQRMLKWSAEPTTAPATSRRDLCPSCPVRSACRATFPEPLTQRDEPPSSAWRPRPDPSGQIQMPEQPQRPDRIPTDADGQQEAEELARAIENSYRAQGVSAVVRGVRIGARLISVEVTVQRGSITHIDRRVDDVLHQLESVYGTRATFEKARSLRLFRAVRREPRDVLLGPLVDREAHWLSERAGRFILGESTEGDVIRGDLSDPSSCHLLIGGMTGSGKSVLLKSLIASMVQFQAPTSIQLSLVDPKRVTFANFAPSIEAHLARPLAFDAEPVIGLLQELCEDMDDRYQAFSDAGVNDIDEYNEAEPADHLARQVLVVDEFQDLVTTKDTSEEFFRLVARLGAKARAAGIHLVLATQRPDAKVVPGRIKANLTGRIALRVPEAVNSRIILDAKGAEHLLGRGDMWVNLTGELVRGQAPRIS